MKIAMMVRGYLTAPKPDDMIYAPIDLAVEIAKGLTAKGHDVTFFGPQGSAIPGVKVEDLNLPPLAHNQTEFHKLVHDVEKQMHYVPGLWDRKLGNEMFIRAEKGEFDILHFHHPEVALAMAGAYENVPVAYTMHDPIRDWYRQLFDLYKSPNQFYISISDNQRRDGPDLPYIATVYNGIDVEKFQYNEEPEDYLVIAGRIVPDKGFKEAIEVAQQTDSRLFIIGPLYSDHQEYFNQHIKPHLNDKILYLGYMDQEQLAGYYQKAKAFILPLQWEEPFGLVMTEAMASGTPVIVFRRGSAEEVIINKKTGFICDSLQDMVSAVNSIESINRKDCREHVVNNFSISNMVDSYESAFEAVLKASRKHK